MGDELEFFLWNLDFYMEKRGYTDASLARALGYKDGSAIGQWRRHKAGPEFRTIGKIARLFGIPFMELLRDPADERGRAAALGLPAPTEAELDERAFNRLARRAGYRVKLQKIKKADA